MFETLRRYFKFLFYFFVWATINVGFHEYTHANILRVLGYGYTVQYFWFSGYVIPLQPISDVMHILAVSFSGGLLTSIMNLAITLFLDPETDWVELCSLRCHMLSQFIYSMIECTYIFAFLSFEAVTAFMSIVNSIIFLYYSFKSVFGGGGDCG